MKKAPPQPKVRERNPAKRSAFTLLELLVVIGVVAIVASIVLPALARAKGRGYTIICLNNHRQLALAWNLYAEDHDGWLPYNLGSSARNLYRFLIRRKIVSGRAGPLPRLKAHATPIGGMDVGYAPRTGMVVYHLPRGAKVRKGATVCEVIDPSDARGPKARTAVAAKTDGILFSRKLDGRLAWPGAVLFRIAGAEVLAHRKGLSGLDD